MDIVKGDFKTIGINEIDIQKVISKWTHLWYLSQWKGEFTLIKYKRKDSPIRVVCIDISNSQALELMQLLNLVQEPSFFKSGSSWRRQSDIDMLRKYRIEKRKKSK